MLRPFCLAVLTGALLIGCATPPAPPRDDSLYRELGEKPGITRIVECTLLNVARDPRIAQSFARLDIVGVRDRLVEQFCVEAGGPCVYTGDSMEEVHKGQNVSRSQFNALVENLQTAMESEGVPTPTQNRLLARLAALRGQIIEQ